jgi:iron complex outermembrane receptor protein
MANTFRVQLLTTTITAGCILAAPASAQSASPAFSNPSQPAPVAEPQDTSSQDPAAADVVVTGTLFRRTNTETPSPVTVLTADNLAKAGINNVTDAVRSISADNSGSIPIGFSAGFANGGAGISLRGLTVNSTLVLFDGMRAANFPLADDGQRNFVDLQTIPDAIVDRVEVLKDGASSTYGADAVAGVVNVITKKQFKGILGTVEGGISQRGDAAEQRANLTLGTGDLADKGFNAYLSVEYQHDDLLKNNQRGFPYNTTNLNSIGGVDNNAGATTAGATTSAVVRPATHSPGGSLAGGTAVPGGVFQVLNMGGCAPGTIPHTAANGSFCEQDIANLTGVISPAQTRFGVTGHLTANVGGDNQVYAIATYYQDRVVTPGVPQSVRQLLPLGNASLPSTGTQNIVLPSRLTNGSLNPNDPFAAAGLDAQIFYRFGDIPQQVTALSRTYRGAIGLTGDSGGWRYSADVTAMRSTLGLRETGFISVPGLLGVIADGSYNFVNPSLNTQAVRDRVAPTLREEASSDLVMAQAVVTRDLFQLSGGAAQLGVGGSIRYEDVDNPNINPNGEILNANPVSARGNHTVEAAYFELNAPLVKALELNLSGRYDHYSEGYSHFSPKVGFKFTPIRQLALRGTYSRGFRAPGFAETQGQVQGFITSPPIPCNIVLQHGGTPTAGGCTGGDAYVKPGPLGLLSVANPQIKPELSRSFTGGVVFQPTHWLSFTADYYNIKKTRVIAGGPDYAAAINAYYAGTNLPAGYTIIANAPDPEHPTGALTVATVAAPYVNAASIVTSGIDISAEARIPISSKVRFTSRLEVTDIFRYDFTSASGTFHYVGTEGPYALSSGAGTPKWRGNWQNSVDAGPFTLTGTAYYTSGFKETADDATGAGTAVDCANELYNGDPAFCRVRRFIQVDLVGSVKVKGGFTFYVDVINAFDAKAPLNAANYAGVNYNPTYHQAGLVGRYFRAGANFKF